jgi:hypothetical protein
MHCILIIPITMFLLGPILHYQTHPFIVSSWQAIPPTYHNLSPSFLISPFLYRLHGTCQSCQTGFTQSCWPQGWIYWQQVVSHCTPMGPMLMKSHVHRFGCLNPMKSHDIPTNIIINSHKFLKCHSHHINPMKCPMKYPLVISQIAIENGHRNSWFTH